MLRFSRVLMALCFLLLSPSLAVAGPSLEDLPITEINEMLESSRAKSKSDIKALMEFGLVVPGGNAKSGLKTVTLQELANVPMYYGGFSKDSSTFVQGNRKWIAWWDVKTLGLKRVVVVESKKHYIFGANRDGSRLVIGKAGLDGNKSEFEFAVHDGTTLKEIKELKYNKQSQKEIFGNFSQAGTMAFEMSPGGRWFILSHSKGPLQVWDATSGALVFENYNYNNKAKNNGMDYSPDDRYVAVRHGGKQVLYSLQPFKKIRDLAEGNVFFSPKGTYVAINGKQLEKVTGGTVCSTSSNKVGSGFTIDESYWLVMYQNGVVYKPMDARDCPEVQTMYFPEEFKKQKYTGTVIPAPDGKRYAVYGAFPPKSGDMLSGQIRMFEWPMPQKESAAILVKAERGLKLYAGGLKKQGEAILKSVVGKAPAELWNKDYEDRFAKAGVPLYLVGQLYLGAARELSHMKTHIWSQYAIVASQAKQPFLAATALAEVNKEFKTGGKEPSTNDLALYTGANALSMMVAGRTDDAYSTLIESGIGKDLVPILKRYADAFAPLLKEPGKLALALDIDKGLLPKPGREGKPQDYVDLQGNLVKVTPPATPTMNQPQTAPAAQPAMKKKSSVILE